MIADSGDPLRVTRAAWREAADRAGVPAVEVEVVCSDPTEHRERATTRVTDIPGLPLPGWGQISRIDYEPWDGGQLTIDTAGRTEEESLAAMLRGLPGDIRA